MDNEKVPDADFWSRARVAFALEVSAIDRDARLSELTPDEIDSIIHGIWSLTKLAGGRP